MKNLIASLICFIFISNAKAQADLSFSFEDCVRYALEHNINIQQSQLQLEISKNSYQNSKMAYTPSLRASVGYNFNFGLNIDPVTNRISESQRQTANFGLSSTWVLYDGGRLYNTISRNNLDYLASLYDLEDAKYDISINVSSAFLQVLLNQEIMAVALEQKRVTLLQVDRMKKMVDAGARPQGDLYQLEAQLARDDQNYIAAENNVSISKLQLGNLLQLENPGAIELLSPEIPIPDIAILSRTPESIYVTAEQNQPQIKSAEKRAESSEEGVDLSRSAFLPTLSLSGQIGTSYSDQVQVATGFIQAPVTVGVTENTGERVITANDQNIPTGFENKALGNQVTDNINEFVGIGLSVPLDFWRTNNSYQTAKLNKEFAHLNLEAAKNTLRQNIYQAHTDAKSSYKSYIAAEASVKSSEESFKYAEERFSVGAMNQLDYENAKNSLAIAKSEALRSKYDVIFKIKVLEFFLTNKLEL